MLFVRWLTALICLSSVATSAWAFDPRGTDILTLRLGMPEATVIDHLTHQGWQLTRVGRCAAENCPDTIRAPTEDGVLLIDFAAGGVVRRVTYILSANTHETAVLVRAAIIEHFGNPSIESPASWCLSLASDGRCSSTQPRLTFQAGEGFDSVLTLEASNG